MELIDSDTPEGEVAAKKALELLEACKPLAAEDGGVAAQLTVALQVLTNVVFIDRQLTHADTISAIGTFVGWAFSDIDNPIVRAMAIAEPAGTAMTVAGETINGGIGPIAGNA